MTGPRPPASSLNYGIGKPQRPSVSSAGVVRSTEDHILRGAEKCFEFASLVNSPRRILWAIQAGWKGESVRSYIRARLGWHVVTEVALTRTENGEPILRVTTPLELTDLNQLETKHNSSSTDSFYDPLFGIDPVEESDPRQSFKVIGSLCTVTAELSGELPPYFRERLQNLCDDANATLMDPLLGDEERMNQLKNLALAAQTQNITRPQNSGWSVLTLFGLFFLAAAMLLGATGVQHYHWQQAVRKIDEVVGIEVISHTTRWGRRQIEVLRDPLADPMSTILKAVGLDVDGVDVKERPFVSGEPMLVASRAKMNPSQPLLSNPPEQEPSLVDSAEIVSSMRLDMVRALIELPPDLELTLSEGRLSARGTLSEPTFGKLARAQSRIPWIKSVDVSQVRNLTEENITSLKNGLEKTQIEFLPASSLLPDASKLRIQTVGSELMMLAEETKLKKQSVRLQFYASHPDVDPSLLMRRVETLVQALQREGMPITWFDPGSGVLEAKSPHSVSLRIQILSSSTPQ
jgi:hypothetical protein